MITRILATAAAATLGASLLWGSAPAQAVPADFEWQGNVNGTVTVEEVSSSSRVTLLATGSTVLLAYQELNALVILSSSDSPSSQFEEWGRIDTTGEVIVSPPRLDAGPDGLVVVTYLVRESDTKSSLRVSYFYGPGNGPYTFRVSGIFTAAGYDLGISDSGAITMVYADKPFEEARIWTSVFDGLNLRGQFLAAGATIGSPRIVVGSDGRALVVWEQRNVNDGTRTLRGAYRAPGAEEFDNFVDLYDGQPVTQWDIDGDASAYVSLFVQDAASDRLVARNSRVPTNNWTPADVIEGPTEDLQWLSVEVTSSSETYFYSELVAVGYETTYSRTRPVLAPDSGERKSMLTGLQQNPNAARVTGVDSEGLPWVVQSLVNGPGEIPQLMSATYSESADGTSINRLGSIVGTAAPFGVTTADAVALDNGPLLAAWVALVDNKTSLFTRWMAPTAPPVAATNVSGEVLDERSVRVTWTNSTQAVGTTITENEVLAYRTDRPGIWARCQASAIATECIFPIGTEPSTLKEGLSYQFMVNTTSTTGEVARSVLSAPVTIPVDPGPDPGPDPGAESILISGTRGEVRGKRGIIVNGTTTGLVGATVIPRYKLPGQAQYEDGVARRTVAADGTFDWQRRTGKKIYVIFKTLDGSVQSPRIIIR